MEKLQTPQENKGNSEISVKKNIFSAFLMPLISVLSFYIVLSGTLSDTNGFLTFVLSVIFPASYGIWAYSAKTNLKRAFPVIAALLVLMLSVSQGLVKIVSDKAIVDAVITGACLIGMSAVVLFCHIKKSGKTVMLAGLSTVLAIASIISLCALTVIENGYFSLQSCVEQINNVFRTIREGVMNLYGTALENDAFLDTFRVALSSAMEADGITKETLMPILSDGVDMIISLIRSCLPALLALYSMAVSAVAVAFYTVFAKSCNMSIGKENEAWEYTVSGITARLFNASLVIAILGSIIRLPSAVLITCVNLSIILTPLLCIIAIKAIYRLLRKKKIPAILSVLIMIACFAVISGIVQLYAFELLAFAGCYITVFKERVKLINNEKNQD